MGNYTNLQREGPKKTLGAPRQHMRIVRNGGTSLLTMALWYLICITDYVYALVSSGIKHDDNDRAFVDIFGQ